MLLKQKLNSISPLKIGFVASFVLHSSLFAFLVVDFRWTETIKSMPSQALTLSLENISGKTIDSRKIKKIHKKHHHHHIMPKKSFIPTEKQIPKEIDEISNNVKSDLDSTMGASTNLGTKIEILGNNDSLYATILDIINKNRHYPKIARARKLQDKIQVEFILLISGKVIGIHIINGQHNILKDDAIETIKRSATQFPKPKQSKKVRVNIVYDLVS